MRVQTFHRHVINRGSPLLGALLMVNRAYSLCLAAPVMWVYLVMRWDIILQNKKEAWYACVVVLWTVAELFRLHFGHKGNRLQSVPSLLMFTGLTLVPQLPFVILYNKFVPRRNSLDFAVSTLLAAFIFSELILSIRLLYIIMSNNRIDYFVYNTRPMM